MQGQRPNAACGVAAVVAAANVVAGIVWTGISLWDRDLTQAVGWASAAFAWGVVALWAPHQHTDAA